MSWNDIIRLGIAFIILGAFLFLKYIFPNNPFIMKYFSGVYGMIGIVVFFILLWRIEVSIARKRKRKEKEDNGVVS